MNAGNMLDIIDRLERKPIRWLLFALVCLGGSGTSLFFWWNLDPVSRVIVGLASLLLSAVVTKLVGRLLLWVWRKWFLPKRLKRLSRADRAVVKRIWRAWRSGRADIKLSGADAERARDLVEKGILRCNLDFTDGGGCFALSDRIRKYLESHQKALD